MPPFVLLLFVRGLTDRLIQAGRGPKREDARTRLLRDADLTCRRAGRADETCREAAWRERSSDTYRAEQPGGSLYRPVRYHGNQRVTGAHAE